MLYIRAQKSPGSCNQKTGAFREPSQHVFNTNPKHKPLHLLEKQQ